MIFGQYYFNELIHDLFYKYDNDIKCLVLNGHNKITSLQNFISFPSSGLITVLTN